MAAMRTALATEYTKKKGAITGIAPTKKETADINPMLVGLSMVPGTRPISSWIINLSQRFLLEVILFTATYKSSS